MYFSSYYSLKQRWLGPRPPGPLEALLLGAGARCLAGTITLPLTLVKTRYEVGGARGEGHGGGGGGRGRGRGGGVRAEGGGGGRRARDGQGAKRAGH